MDENRLKNKIKELEQKLTAQQAQIEALERENIENRQAKERFDTLLSEIPYKIFFKDLEGRFVYGSRQCALRHGLKDISELIGKTDFDFFDKKFAARTLADEKKIIKTGKPVMAKEECTILPNGDERWVQVTKIPWRDSKGKIIGIYGISRSIDTAKKTEETLQALMENIPDTIYFKDRMSRFVAVNKSCVIKHGYKGPEEIIGKTDADIFSEDFSRATFEEEQRIIKTGEPLIGKEEYETFPDGKQYWMLATKMPWRDKHGDIIGTFGISRDISKIKQVEHQLSILMKNIPDAIYFKDRFSRFTLISNSTARSLGVEKPEDAYGKTDFDFYSKEHAQPAYEDEQYMIKTGRAIVGKEELEAWQDGTSRWISTTKLPLKDENGEIIGTFGLSRDINRLKQAEEALQDANEKLEKKVQKRTAELRRANEGMRDRIQQLDYLNRKAHFFTQLIDRDTLLPAIFYAFVERFQDGEVHLADMESGGFRTVYSTSELRHHDMLSGCIRALDYLETDKEEGLYFEGCWMENSLLKDLFHASFRKFPCYIVIPLITDKKLRGVVQVFAPVKFKKVFNQESIVLNTLAAQSAMSLDNANNYRQLEERTRLKSELEIAQGIQKRFTPKDPIIPNFTIKGICQPANEVGGDYLDFFQNNHGDWIFVIADVCGKGIPAALVMTSLRSTVRTQARDETSSKRLLSSVNELMGLDLQMDNSFITCMVLIINKEGTRMNFTRAGHPMLVAYSSIQAPRVIPSGGIAIGMIMGEQFNSIIEEVHLDLATGDKFLAYTDGLDEAMNASKEPYGSKRLLDLLKEGRALSPAEVVDLIIKDVENFCGHQRQYDDLTLFVLEKS